MSLYDIPPLSVSQGYLRERLLLHITVWLPLDSEIVLNNGVIELLLLFRIYPSASVWRRHRTPLLLRTHRWYRPRSLDSTELDSCSFELFSVLDSSELRFWNVSTMDQLLGLDAFGCVFYSIQAWINQQNCLMQLVAASVLGLNLLLGSLELLMLTCLLPSATFIILLCEKLVFSCKSCFHLCYSCIGSLLQDFSLKGIISYLCH